MIIGKLLFRILPVDVYKKYRDRYFRILKQTHKPLTEDEFRAILRDRCGVLPGKTVFVHSSAGHLNIGFSSFRLLSILIDLTGPDGTLLFPAWHFSYRAEEYLSKDLVFDVKKSPSVLGLLPELARRNPGAHRSLHPTNSIVAIGRHAEELVSAHHLSPYPCGEMSPLYKMMKYDAIIVGIGVNTNFLSFFHCAEDMMRDRFPLQTLTDDLFDGKVIDASSREFVVKTYAAHRNIRSRDVPRFVRKYISREACEDFTERGNRFFRADSRALFKQIVDLAENGVIVYDKKPQKNIQ